VHRLTKEIAPDRIGLALTADDVTFNVTLELVKRRYTEAQIGQLWSGNRLRVMADLERIAREIQAGKRCASYVGQLLGAAATQS
jgi:hypothetical protein